MRAGRSYGLRRGAAFVLLAAAAVAAPAPDAPYFRISGGYLAYSFDHSWILGDSVTVAWNEWTLTARTLKIDLPARRFEALGGVVLAKGAERIEADEFFFEPADRTGVLVRFKDVLETAPFPSSRSAVNLDETVRAGRAALVSVDWAGLRSSLLFATARAIELTPSGEAVGIDITLFVEGLPSVGIARFKLTPGESDGGSGMSLDKIWFTRYQGLFGDLSYALRIEKKLRSLTTLHYEEHSLLSDDEGLPRLADLQTATSWTVGRGLALGLNANASSTGLWNSSFSLRAESDDSRQGVQLEMAYVKPLGSPGQTWLGLQSNLDSDSWGRLAVQSRYELGGQALFKLNYQKSFGRKVAFRLDGDYSHIRAGGGTASEIFTGTVSLSYTADPVQASAEYFLNDDLLGRQRLIRPQLRLGLRPVTFYGGLLTASMSDVFVLNSMHGPDGTSNTYNNNTVFGLAAAPIRISPGLTLRMSLAAEQFVEKEGRNFTSGGAVVRLKREFAPGISVEAIWSGMSRRRSRDWLIEGTTSQDLTALVRIRPEARLSGWASVSCDPKNGEWKRGFADLSLGLVRNWKIQTLLNYDLALGRLADVDLDLVRRAGRFDLRLGWRSMSKQVVIELIPAK